MSVERLNHRDIPSQKELNTKKTRRWLWLILAVALVGGGIVANEVLEKKECQPVKFKPARACIKCKSPSKKKEEKPKKEKKSKPYKGRKRYRNYEYA
ncbi:hypothetical protein KAR91_02880 [Candidatus Pacearchaeota archaeon]|nr:hypothetical protein [Candidatus Pacearchaeota archaeon]